eukprot:TRINITY_DN1397_c0_g1::TRINITY_DN1397_c0_g1_i1::g.19949::m.19949 TRINITY_DN1397_c0_g1::TRINITY_DN1397_c0_g1_i1::g.19949  ORF type:complete len:491 (+),score=94.92,sp/Q96AY4/TTC28_HUMAN/27.11/2e-15,sp/Q96AY4/TTC28_HUMAN/25.00/5e-10,sp/Q96AY4/TTC28_HUMAN/24.59/2e-09,sp/Q96AY4/TTC28_HUMAN/27.44/2e-08,sp/Q96AY4/TTC28_HUMAN/25.51/1e-06,TPR_12/PF13424.1/0.012,TPR_12/PF13424.1/0.00014,TPR_12/PF13424.1/3,TPR_12/PF13424.1/5.3e-05,TPR_11/PF13414.1/0.0017,TPR_11/PF13414.1/0.59,TPR_11/PF13414.1/4.7,TPR_1/PF0
MTAEQKPKGIDLESFKFTPHADLFRDGPQKDRKEKHSGHGAPERRMEDTRISAAPPPRDKFQMKPTPSSALPQLVQSRPKTIPQSASSRRSVSRIDRSPTGFVLPTPRKMGRSKAASVPVNDVMNGAHALKLETIEAVNPFLYKVNAPQRLTPWVFPAVPREVPKSGVGMSPRLRPLVASTNARDADARRTRDQDMLAAAARRSGHPEWEALAYFNQGVLQDNKGAYKKAIPLYKKFLEKAKEAQNREAMALAYNSIGTNYMLLGGKECVAKAVKYHKAHLDLSLKQMDELSKYARSMRAPDPEGLNTEEEKEKRKNLIRYYEEGRFVAASNLGLCQLTMGDLNMAAHQHERALHYAKEAQDPSGESVALANLAITGRFGQQYASARALLERHLHMADKLKDTPARTDAYGQLGSVASAQHDYSTAARFFECEMMLARDSGNSSLANTAKCNFGIAAANHKMDQYMGWIAGQLVQENATSASTGVSPIPR